MEPVKNDSPRKTLVVKTITRKYNLGNFESIDISISHNQEIEWKDQEERSKKSDALTKLLIKDFEKSRDTIFFDLSESENNVVSKKEPAKLGE